MTQINHTSIGKDGSIWAILAEDSSIARLYGDAGHVGWSPVSQGKGKVIAAVDFFSAWCVNAENQLWNIKTPDRNGNEQAWEQVAPAAILAKAEMQRGRFRQLSRYAAWQRELQAHG